MWIWQHDDWPSFSWQEQMLAPKLRNIRKLEGILQGKSQIFLSQNDPAEHTLKALTQNIFASAELEDDVDYRHVTHGTVLDAMSKRLGVTFSSELPSDPLAEGLAAIQMDVYNNSKHELGINRFFRWHVNLYSDINVAAGIRPGAINVGKLRGEQEVQIVSGGLEQRKVHFEAPPKAILKTEIEQFLTWFKTSKHDETIDPILRASLAHLWFMTLHPFEHGNTVLGRAVIDLALMQNNPQYLDLYSFSGAMLDNKNDYVEMLQYTQRNDMDISHWMLWFVVTLEHAIQTAIDDIDQNLSTMTPQTVAPAQQNAFQNHALNKHQVKVLRLMTEANEQGTAEFEAGIGAAHYQRITRVSKATATRHLADLLAKKCIKKLPGGGRSTRYELYV